MRRLTKRRYNVKCRSNYYAYYRVLFCGNKFTFSSLFSEIKVTNEYKDHRNTYVYLVMIYQSLTNVFRHRGTGSFIYTIRIYYFKGYGNRISRISSLSIFHKSLKFKWVRSVPSINRPLFLSYRSRGTANVSNSTLLRSNLVEFG